MYRGRADHIDELAERTLAVGAKPVLQEDDTSPAAETMAANLRADLERLNHYPRELSRTAGEAGDVGTVNLADGIADAQDKTVWMLRAFSG